MQAILRLAALTSLSFCTLFISVGCSLYSEREAKSYKSSRVRIGDLRLENYERLVELQEKRRQEDRIEILISAGDTIEVTCESEPILDGLYKVSSKGIVDFPLIKEVYVAQLEPSELETQLKEKLKNFVNDPMLRVDLKYSDSNSIYLLGEIRVPGKYALQKANTTILDALGLASGLTVDASFQVILRPAENCNSIACDEKSFVSAGGNTLFDSIYISVNINDLINGRESEIANITLKSGDVLYVPKAGKALIAGEVRNTGVFRLSANQSLLSAIGSAGGLKYSSDPQKIVLLREASNAFDIYSLDEIRSGAQRNEVLQSGDVVIVASSEVRKSEESLWRFVSKTLQLRASYTFQLNNISESEEEEDKGPFPK